jgi:N6-adenosine-specific RNA methylase IME4
MRGKACSAEFMRRIRQMMEMHEGKRKELVNFIAHQTCLKPRQIYNLVACEDLRREICRYLQNDEPHPTILIEALRSPDSGALALEAIENEWTAEQVRLEASRRKAGALANSDPAPIPDGQYRTVVVDPPWAYGNVTGRHGPDYAPRMMTVQQITDGQFAPDFQIRDRFHHPCHLYLWATDAYVGECYAIIRAWGFEPKCTIVWVKDRVGMGNYFRHQHELCVFAVKGKMRLKRMDASTVLKAKATGHSAKPKEFYDLVETCSPGPYLDVFARQYRPGWAIFGDEVNASPYQLRVVGIMNRQG